MSAGSTTALPAQPLVRERTRIRTSGADLQRSNTTPLPSATSPTLPQLPERRSSGLSFISDDRRHSVTSTANDFILPSVGDSFESDREEPSHWHSTPLAFAFLPAIGGLFFTNGSAFITDILLLGLAAIFLNWSVRLPWDWYHRAQTTVYLPRSRSNSNSSERDEAATKAAREAARSKLEGESTTAIEDDDASDHSDAAQQLRTHEIFALLSTFLFPVFAAYLLHLIRGQLSRQSTGLVSDYNLTIFLLAAEIRPFRHLIRLITNRTVHLQRLVNPDNSSRATMAQQSDLSMRLEQLEAKLAEQLSTSSPLSPSAAKEDLTALSTDLKKRYEPRIDALERALRRYEKRVTTLTILTEQRLQNLQSKLDDALSLAAVAAQSSQKQGLVAGVFAWSTLAVKSGVQAVLSVIVAPLALASDVSRRTSVVLFGPAKAAAATGTRRDGEGRKRKMDKIERMEKVDRERMRRVKE